MLTTNSQLADNKANSHNTLRLKGTSYLDLVNIWAVSRAGYIPQLISIRMPNPDVVFEMLKQAGAAALIVDPSFEPLLTETTLPILFSASLTSSSGDGLPKLPQLDTPPDPNDTLMIFHTSGSTSGHPKLVPVTARWLDFAIEKMSHSKLFSSSGKQQVVVSGYVLRPIHFAENLCTNPWIAVGAFATWQAIFSCGDTSTEADASLFQQSFRTLLQSLNRWCHSVG